MGAPKKNGIAGFVKLGVGISAFMAVVVKGFEIIDKLLAMNEIANAITVAVLILSNLIFIVRDIFTSAREEFNFAFPSGYEAEITILIKQEGKK